MLRSLLFLLAALPTFTVRPAELSSRPEVPAVVRDGAQWVLNLELDFETGAGAAEIEALELELRDAEDRLLAQRRAPGSQLAFRALGPGRSVLPNPFHRVSAYAEPARILFRARLADGQVLEHRLAGFEVHRAAPVAATLPLQPETRQRALVLDGHDRFSRHRTAVLAMLRPELQELAGPAQRFAVDLVLMEPDGRRASGPGRDAHFTWNAAVVAPVRGQVLRVVGDLPDREMPGDPAGSEGLAGLGNHVIIEARDGSYWLLAQLRQGSVEVRPGEEVLPGTPIGRVGLSGGASEPWLHLQRQDRADPLEAQGLPAFFDVRQCSGEACMHAPGRFLDTGDIVLPGRMPRGRRAEG